MGYTDTPISLETIESQVAEDGKCSSCGKRLGVKHLTGHNYDHDAGIVVPELGRKWLYLQCPYCGYQTALWKIRLPRYQQ